MEIIPHIGFGKIKFGLSEMDIVKELGEPTRRERRINPDESETIELEYDELGIQLSLSSDDNFRLGTMTFFNENFTLWGESFYSKDESFLIEQQKKEELKDLKLDDDFVELNSKDYYSPKKGILIYLHEGIISNISIFPEYDDSGINIIWPDSV